MTQILIAYEFRVRTRVGARLATDRLHQQGERLMDALLNLEKVNPEVADSSTSSDASRGTVTAELLVAAEDEPEALQKFLTVVRTAIHAIGGSTPHWGTAGDSQVEYVRGAVKLDLIPA